MTTDVAPLPLTLSEHDFQNTVIDYAKLRGWLVCHIRPAKTDKGWRTPIEGDPGLPDLIMARDGKVILAELKSTGGRATPMQKRWLEESNGHLWSPAWWPEIVSILR